MSALVDRVVSKHYKSVSAVDKCVCGLTLYGNLARHVAAIIEAAVREQIAADIEAQLPQRLINEIGDACGWLSDAQSGVRLAATGGTLRFHGEGSLDLTHAAEHAARIAKGTP